MMRSSSAGKSGRTLPIATGSEWRMASTIWMSVVPPNGRRPVAIW